jgi:Na+/H+-translocating membrane pyrophosphatase
MVTAVGIFASFLTMLFACCCKVRENTIESCMKLLLLFSTLLMTLMLAPLAHYYLPNKVQIEFAGKVYLATRWKLYGCVNMGLWTGLFIGYVTEFYTSSQFEPVVTLAEATRTGAGPTVIAGLALGYSSTIIPVILLAVTVYVSFTFAGMYGIALAAIGMLGCLPVALSLDGYGPIADNAGGIAEMS